MWYRALIAVVSMLAMMGCQPEMGKGGVQTQAPKAKQGKGVDHKGDQVHSMRMEVLWGAGTNEPRSRSLVITWTYRGKLKSDGCEARHNGCMAQVSDMRYDGGELIAFAHQVDYGPLQCNMWVDDHLVDHEHRADAGDVICHWNGGYP